MGWRGPRRSTPAQASSKHPVGLKDFKHARSMERDLKALLPNASKSYRVLGVWLRRDLMTWKADRVQRPFTYVFTVGRDWTSPRIVFQAHLMGGGTVFNVNEMASCCGVALAAERQAYPFTPPNNASSRSCGACIAPDPAALIRNTTDSFGLMRTTFEHVPQGSVELTTALTDRLDLLIGDPLEATLTGSLVAEQVSTLMGYFLDAEER